MKRPKQPDDYTQAPALPTAPTEAHSAAWPRLCRTLTVRKANGRVVVIKGALVCVAREARDSMSFKLHHGDCLAMLDKVPRGVIVISDPPYGKSLKNHATSANGSNCRRRTTRSYSIAGDKCQTVGLQVLRWCEQHSVPTLFFASPRHAWPGEWRNFLVWDKGGAVGGGGDPATCWKQTWELIQGTRNGPLNGFRDNAVLRYYITPADMLLHPTQKPVELMRYFIEKLTQPGDTVFDPFMGSGTTGVAAIECRRNFIGCEISADYFNIAKERIERAANRLQTDKPLRAAEAPKVGLVALMGE